MIMRMYVTGRILEPSTSSSVSAGFFLLTGVVLLFVASSSPVFCPAGLSKHIREFDFLCLICIQNRMMQTCCL